MSAKDGVLLVRYHGARWRCSATTSGWWPWAMKEMVRAIFAPGLTVEAVSELIDRLLGRLSRCRLKPFIRLGRTIRKHREGILAARRLKLSNARAEALNNKAKLIVRPAYGFHSAAAALALIHLTCGPVTLTLPHEQAFA